ncbi:hypothetical protein EII17_10740 [Clostridiales bacterium COT073_COT-073]|nr:hypothetical protein EII17_10740 [Clostridiales bacterium COT073_COT-073]
MYYIPFAVFLFYLILWNPKYHYAPPVLLSLSAIIADLVLVFFWPETWPSALFLMAVYLFLIKIRYHSKIVTINYWEMDNGRRLPLFLQLGLGAVIAGVVAFYFYKQGVQAKPLLTYSFVGGLLTLMLTDFLHYARFRASSFIQHLFPEKLKEEEHTAVLADYYTRQIQGSGRNRIAVRLHELIFEGEELPFQAGYFDMKNFAEKCGSTFRYIKVTDHLGISWIKRDSLELVEDAGRRIPRLSPYYQKFALAERIGIIGSIHLVDYDLIKWMAAFGISLVLMIQNLPLSVAVIISLSIGSSCVPYYLLISPAVLIPSTLVFIISLVKRKAILQQRQEDYEQYGLRLYRFQSER